MSAWGRKIFLNFFEKKENNKKVKFKRKLIKILSRFKILLHIPLYITFISFDAEIDLFYKNLNFYNENP